MKLDAVKAKNLAVIELALPAMMLFLMMEACVKMGIEARSDVMHKVNMASAVPFKAIDMLSIPAVAKQTDDFARSLLRDLNPSDPREGLYVCAMFILLLVDEGRLTDPKSMAVLAALLLIEDVKDEEPDVNGFRPVWFANELKWKAEAGKLLNRAMLQGLYTGIAPVSLS